MNAVSRLCRPVGAFPPVCVNDTAGGAPGVVDLWYLSYQPGTIECLRPAWEPLLSPEERLRARAFRFDADAAQYVAARALIRTALSQYCKTAPSAWRFTSGPFGKPFIAHPTPHPYPHFSLAHTHGLLACIVSIAHTAIGVDVESRDQRGDVRQVAASVFPPDAVRLLASLPPEESAREFVALWTLRESYLKAIGLGLHAPPASISFESAGDRIRLVAEAARNGGGCWRFALVDCVPAFTIAIAADTDGTPLSVRARPLSPADCVPAGF